MCGIFGIVVRNGRVDSELLQHATDSLAHRGPDDSGTVILTDAGSEPLELGLGSRRLAIQDLSPAGRQPMHDPESGNWIIFNGEIYNFREIREELLKGGVQFRSHSDTEVLLKAYGRYGIGLLPKLQGMFAFAIWDSHAHRLLLARDPMGIKPLYYFHAGTILLFASELRTLLTTGLVPRHLDQAGLASFLSFGSAYDPVTLIANVSALRAGHYAIWQDGHFCEHKYWSLAPKSRPGELTQAVHDTVRMHTVSDVPIGLFLSGGIDSSVIAAILADGNQPLATFSMVFDEPGYSERDYSREIARKFGTKHHEVKISAQEALESWPGFLSAMDQPSIDGLNTYLIARETRSTGIKVVLSGLGGDELFAGYDSFRSVPRMESFLSVWSGLPKVARSWLTSAFQALSRSNDRNRKLYALASENGRLIHPYFLSRMLFTPCQRQSLFPCAEPDLLKRASASQRECVAEARDFDPANRVSYLESRSYMLNTLLRDADSMSMAHGLELRVPFVDHRLAEQLMAIPGAGKRANGIPKPLLVNAAKGALPAQVVRRKKRGFTLPFEHWLRNELRSEVERGLRSISEGVLGRLLDHAAVAGTWEDFQHCRTSWSRPWALFVLQRWCELNQLQASN